MKRWKKGSYTVEAAFLIPMVVALLILLIVYDFYVHNKNWYLAAAYETALTGNGRGEEKNGAAEKEAKKKAEERADQQVMPGSRPDIQVNSYSWGMQVQYSGQKFPIFSSQWFPYAINVKVEKVRPVKYLQTLWMMRKSENDIDETIGGGAE